MLEAVTTFSAVQIRERRRLSRSGQEPGQPPLPAGSASTRIQPPRPSSLHGASLVAASSKDAFANGGDWHLQLQHHHDLPPEQPDGIRLHVVHADQPSDRFETKWCSRKNKVRSLPRPATQRHRHASADSSQGSLLPHSAAHWDFQWMFPHWNSSCSFGRHSRGSISEDPAQRQVQPPFATVHT